MPFSLSKYSWLAVLVTVILVTYQVTRLVVFVNVYGGIEYDSGWFLGVARSLAERGTYTTLVSTMADPQVAVGLDMNQEFFQIQDPEGRIYFFAEGTTGPTQVVPDALVLRLFGSGFWQLRAASLGFYVFFLLLCSWLLLRWGGFPALFLFHAFILLYPHLSVFLGYESLGEVPVAACVLLAYTLFATAAAAGARRKTWFLLSGLAAGLAILGKLIALIPLASLGLLWLVLFLKSWPGRPKTTFFEALIVVGGAVALPLLWELTQLIAISRLFGFETYWQHAGQRFDLILNYGSGLVTDQVHAWPDFFWYKLLLIGEISHPSPVFALSTMAVILLGGAFLIGYFRADPPAQNLVSLLWGGWLIHTVWFVTISENGWVRHTWVALILGILILSLLWSNLVRAARTARPAFLTAVALTLLIGINFYSQRQAATPFITESLVQDWYEQHLAAQQTRLPWTIVPRADQEAVAAVLQQLPPAARIFYPGNIKSPEIAALTGRVFYPLVRRPLMSPSSADVVLIGAALISPWTKFMEKPMIPAERQVVHDSVMERIRQECPQAVFENDYYMICPLP